MFPYIIFYNVYYAKCRYALMSLLASALQA